MKEKNKWLITILFVITVFAAAAYAIDESEKLSAPAIKFTETRFNCGAVKEGDIVSHDFEFVNTGNSALKIKELVPA